jgi:hypothetical protein
MNETHRTTANLTTPRRVPVASSRERGDSPNWGRYAAYAAFAWAILFAIPNLYWAAGGTLGAGTIGGEIEQQALDRETGMVATLWITGLLKVAGAIFVLALVQPWGRRLPRRLMITLGWGGGLSMMLYGISLLVQHGLMLTDVIDRQESLDATALRWHFLFWDPWWLLGGVLFALAAWFYMRGKSGPNRR